jgi:transcriptional regulator with XRE-family HTH domain
MRKALRESRLGVADMADYLGVSRTSVSNWINGRISPSVQTLRLWALRTGVRFEWLAGDQFPRRRGFRTGPSKTPLLTLVTRATRALAA